MDKICEDLLFVEAADKAKGILMAAREIPEVLVDEGIDLNESESRRVDDEWTSKFLYIHWSVNLQGSYPSDFLFQREFTCL
jgi:hypothetical protein